MVWAPVDSHVGPVEVRVGVCGMAEELPPTAPVYLNAHKRPSKNLQIDCSPPTLSLMFVLGSLPLESSVGSALYEYNA